MSEMMTPDKVLYNLGPLTRLPPGEGRTFRIGASAVAVFRTREGRVFATQATCPHKNGPLGLLDLTRLFVRCMPISFS